MSRASSIQWSKVAWQKTSLPLRSRPRPACRFRRARELTRTLLRQSGSHCGFRSVPACRTSHRSRWEVEPERTVETLRKFPLRADEKSRSAQRLHRGIAILRSGLIAISVVAPDIRGIRSYLTVRARPHRPPTCATYLRGRSACFPNLRRGNQLRPIPASGLVTCSYVILNC